MVLLRRAYECGFRTVGHLAKTDTAFESLSDNKDFQRLLPELH